MLVYFYFCGGGLTFFVLKCLSTSLFDVPFFDVRRFFNDNLLILKKTHYFSEILAKWSEGRREYPTDAGMDQPARVWRE